MGILDNNYALNPDGSIGDRLGGFSTVETGFLTVGEIFKIRDDDSWDYTYLGRTNGGIAYQENFGNGNIYVATNTDLARFTGTEIIPQRFKLYDPPNEATAGDDDIIGSFFRDHIRGLAGNDHIEGRPGNDVLFGNGGNDHLEGEQGRDKLRGGKGADWLEGDEGADKIWGGRGKDYIVGGTGNDRMKGGGGADTFAFTPGFGKDKILDFNVNRDTLDFYAITFGSGTGDLAFVETARGLKVMSGSDQVLLLGLTMDDKGALDIIG